MEGRKKTYGEAIGEALEQAMEKDASVFVMGEDVGIYGGSFGVTKGLIEKFGENRVRDTPISEGGIMGVAIGAAIMGMRPVVEIMFSDFITLAMDQLVNTAAKTYYMYGGQMAVPLVLRTASGSGTGAGAQHSQSLEAWMCHIPGLKVVAPSTPSEAKGLLLSAIIDKNPVIFLEQKRLYKTIGIVEENMNPIPLGKADIKREGDDLSIITYGSMVPIAIEAANYLEKRYAVSIEVTDLRTLAPLDIQAIRGTVAKTGKVLILHEACKTGGLGGEILSIITEDEKTFSRLQVAPKRICGEDIPIPFAKELEQASVPTVEKLVKEIKKMVNIVDDSTKISSRVQYSKY